MKSPAFQFYPKDFLASPDVQMMNAREVGAYCLLLFNAWEATDRPGYLPNDERKLMRWARLSKEEWADSRDILLDKFPESECGQYRLNKRLVAEAEKQEVRRERLAANGAKGGRPPKNLEETKEEPRNNLQVSQQNLQVPVGNLNERLASASAIASTKKEKLASSAGQELASPIESSNAPQRPTGRPKQYRYDNAPVFLITEFFAYLRNQGYGHVDMPMYLQRIQEGARKGVHDTRKLKEEATNDEWKAFILAWLDGDKRGKRLLLPDEAPQRPAPAGYGGPNPALQVTTTTANYGPDRIAAQATKVFY